MKANYFPAFNHTNDSQLITWTVNLNVLISDICFSVIWFIANIGDGTVYQTLFLQKGHEHTWDISLDHNVTKVIWVFLFRTSSLQPPLCPLLFDSLSACFLGVSFSMAQLPPNFCTLFRLWIPRKTNQYWFSLYLKILMHLNSFEKKQYEKELPLPMNERDHKETTAVLDSTHVSH